MTPSSTETRLRAACAAVYLTHVRSDHFRRLSAGRVDGAFCGALHFGIFVAFATIYPSAGLLLRITAKWTAVILGAIYTLQLLAYHSWTDLAVVWTSIAAGFVFVRLRGVGPELIWWENFKARLQPKPRFKVVPKPVATRREEDDISESVDPILDKIARSGIGSLTPSERRTLDRARNRLLKESK